MRALESHGRIFCSLFFCIKVSKTYFIFYKANKVRWCWTVYENDYYVLQRRINHDVNLIEKTLKVNIVSFVFHFKSLLFCGFFFSSVASLLFYCLLNWEIISCLLTLVIFVLFCCCCCWFLWTPTQQHFYLFGCCVLNFPVWCLIDPKVNL